jgi:hypothetical protein
MRCAQSAVMRNQAGESRQFLLKTSAGKLAICDLKVGYLRKKYQKKASHFSLNERYDGSTEEP